MSSLVTQTARTLSQPLAQQVARTALPALATKTAATLQKRHYTVDRVNAFLLDPTKKDAAHQHLVPPRAQNKLTSYARISKGFSFTDRYPAVTPILGLSALARFNWVGSFAGLVLERVGYGWYSHKKTRMLREGIEDVSAEYRPSLISEIGAEKYERMRQAAIVSISKTYNLRYNDAERAFPKG